MIKTSAASKELLRHTGHAVIFEDIHDPARRADDPDLAVTAESVLVLRNAGPKGGPGMPERGHPPIPRKLLQAGVPDRARMSDARMSGTSFGAVVLHIAPEAALGGPLSLIADSDNVEHDVQARRLHLAFPHAELKRRAMASRPRAPH